MNRFVHRILKSSTGAGLPAVHQLVKELQNAKLVYFGEFHSENRVVSFQTELIKEWARNLAASSSTVNGARPRLHLVMEHFSVDMQSILDEYQQGGGEHKESDDEAFDSLVNAYKNNFGTEGHDLQPYRNLLQFCRHTTTSNINLSGGGNGYDGEAFCEVHLHGGFIPRNHAARLNKECPDAESKKVFFEEMSNQRGYLPKEQDAMYNALFEGGNGDASSYKLRGSREHKLLIQSLMRGTDLYSPIEGGGEGGDDDGITPQEEESPLSRLYQAQVMKDHAMGYKIANLMLDHYGQTNNNNLGSDRYIVIAGFGHVKHCLGVPDCAKGYLRSEALTHPDSQRRAAAMDLLLSISRPPQLTESNANQRKLGGNGSAIVGCQMLYEAYLEDSYPPIKELSNDASDEDGEEDDGEAERMKQELLKQLFLRHPERLDECISKSQEVSGPLLNFANGIAGFEHPCADYLFIYDEDDDNEIDQADLQRSSGSDAKCPFHQTNESANASVKAETAEAYERVGATAGKRGNAAKARAIMAQIGYTEADMSYIGDKDLFNYQGVANPHSVAKIQQGESVLDVGSGLGIDSFLAMRDSGAGSAEEVEGKAPFVVGVDLAQNEVNHAMKRAAERGYVVPQRIQFIHGDVEKLGEAFSAKNLAMGKFDVAISNGAFCLVPDKKKAFENVFNALRPGGRMAISTSTILSGSLDPSFEWPVCMRMFARLESIKPMCESIGFKNVEIIDAESPMEGIELPVDEDTDISGRFKIHGQCSDQYQFLADMDMDDLCKIVTVYGEKP